MGLSQGNFITFCSIIFSGIVWSYSAFNEYFSEAKSLKIQITKLEKKIEYQHLQNALTANQVTDLQQSILKSIPQIAKNNVDPTIERLKVSLRAPASIAKLELSSVLFEEAKVDFQNRAWKKSAIKFQKVIDEYPLSEFVPHAYFLLGESLFLQKDFISCLKVIEEMMALFPDHVLTGYILLRMGQINESNHQVDSALEIYTLVKENFADPKLKAQAATFANKIDPGNSIGNQNNDPH